MKFKGSILTVKKRTEKNWSICMYVPELKKQEFIHAFFEKPAFVTEGSNVEVELIKNNGFWNIKSIAKAEGFVQEPTESIFEPISDRWRECYSFVEGEIGMKPMTDGQFASVNSLFIEYNKRSR